MAHGITLAMRGIKPGEPRYLFRNPELVKVPGGFRQPRSTRSYVNPERDRSLRSKARIRARKAARR
jgi:hypothetical protein